jgi:hypothetical protein
MLSICQGRHDHLVIALVGRTVSTLGDGVALVALTLRLQADGAHPYEVGLLLAAGVIPQLLLARPVGRLVDAHDSRRLLVGGGLAEVAAGGAVRASAGSRRVVMLIFGGCPKGSPRLARPDDNPGRGRPLRRRAVCLHELLLAHENAGARDRGRELPRARS